jgi:hypothetical protein
MEDEMDEKKFQSILRAAIESQWDRFPYYRNLCGREGLGRADLLMIIDHEEYHRIPGVVSPAFKLSKGLTGDLNDLSGPGAFQVSSSTSGDPSYIYTSSAELARIADRYRLTFGIPGVPKALAFAPSLRILRALSKKAGLPGTGKPAILRMQLALEGGYRHYEKVDVTVDVDLLKTVLGRAVRRPASLRKASAEDVASILRDAERSGSPITIGGVVLLLQPYLALFREGEFHLGANGYIAFSGGGYSGAKGSIRGDKIDKPRFFSDVASILGIDESDWASHIKDIYGFTETPALCEGRWSPENGDFVFHADPDARLYIVDPETEAPLRAGRGLLKVIAPSLDARPAAANVSVLQYDEAEIVTSREDGRIEAFTHVARYQGRGASVEGCAFKAAEIAGL